ncbi:MAG: hypothetical protein WC899_04290 [bacterium]|jgi:hypothetical protein
MKIPCRLAAHLLILLLFGLVAFPGAVRAAEDATDAIEKELGSVLREMDGLSSELTRIEEVTVAPKATSLRIEILRAGGIAPPVSAKLILSGIAGAEREFSKEERDAFLTDPGGIVWIVPVLPGQYEARLVLSHPYAKQSPSFDFRPSLKSGETFRLRLKLGFAREKTGAVLVAFPEK